MKFIKKNLFKMAFMAFFVITPIISFAQVTIIPCEGTGKICNPIKTNDINTLVKTILDGVIRAGIPVIALAIIYCGFLFVSAQGNSEKLTKAKNALLYTLIGSAILLGSWAIAQLISTTVSAL
jgi:hypothetical protein